MAKKGNWKTEFKYSDLSRELRQKGPERLYLLHGREEYLLERFGPNTEF